MMEYVVHPLIKPNKVEKRPYQLALAKTALERSSLIVLPTGLGYFDSFGIGRSIPLQYFHLNFFKSVRISPDQQRRSGFTTNFDFSGIPFMIHHQNFIKVSRIA